MNGKVATAEEYIELIRQALFEIEDIRAAMEFDEDGIQGAQAYITQLETGVRTMYDQMKRGDYQFQNQDLPFMTVARAQDYKVLPFKALLEEINRIHRNGLDVEEI